MIRWKRANGGFVESHDGEWEITPWSRGGARPQVYTLWRRKPGSSSGRQKVTFGLATQRLAKLLANEFVREEGVR